MSQPNIALTIVACLVKPEADMSIHNRAFSFVTELVLKPNKKSLEHLDCPFGYSIEMLLHTNLQYTNATAHCFLCISFAHLLFLCPLINGTFLVNGHNNNTAQVDGDLLGSCAVLASRVRQETL